MSNATTIAPRPANRPGCAPWCADHHDGASPEDGFCRRRAAGEFSSMYLSTTPYGPMVFAYEATPEEFTPAQARAYAFELLALVLAAESTPGSQA